MPHGVDLLRCLERVRSARNTEESTSCTLSTKIEPDSRGSSPAMTRVLIRLHEILVDDGTGVKPLVDKTLPLQPFDLVVDVLHIELAVGIDIGAIAGHLLDR